MESKVYKQSFTFDEVFCLLHNLIGLIIPEDSLVVQNRLRVWHTMRYNNGAHLTKTEACIMLNCTLDTIPKMKKGKRNIRLRQMLGLLTSAERSKYDRAQHKQKIMDKGAEKIYALIDRALSVENNNVAAS